MPAGDAPAASQVPRRAAAAESPQGKPGVADFAAAAAARTGSMITPPPRVRRACASRAMKTSPTAAQIGASNTSCTRVSPPPTRCSVSSMTTRATRWAVPRCTCSGARSDRDALPGSQRSSTSSRVLGTSARGSASQSPRVSAALVDSRQIQRTALAGPTDSAVAILRVDAAHANLRAGRHHVQGVAHLDAACQHCAGRHRAAARQGKHPIDRQSK